MIWMIGRLTHLKHPCLVYMSLQAWFVNSGNFGLRPTTAEWPYSSSPLSSKDMHGIKCDPSTVALSLIKRQLFNVAVLHVS